MRRVVLPSVVLLLFALGGPVFAAEKPNVVYILSDDVGWGDLSVHGGGVPTPNIDKLFSKGVELSNFMGWCVCSPTRAMLLTGRHGAWVDTEDLNGVANDLHCSAEEYKMLGDRFAQESIASIKKYVERQTR